MPETRGREREYGSRRGSGWGGRARSLAVAVLALGVLWAGGAGSTTPGVEIDQVFRDGERLVFDVTWMGIKAGQATLEARGVVRMQGQPAYHLVTTAQSAPFISAFYRVDDRSDSYLAASPYRSLRFDKQLREGNYRHNSQALFDHGGKRVTFRYLDFSPVPKGITSLEEAEKHTKYVTQEFPLGPNALDELSVLYYVRTLPLIEGRTVFATVFASRKNWELEVKALRRETLDTILGRRETLVVEPLLKFEGIFQQKGRVIVWLTNDAERIPVLMKSEIKIGSFVSTLTQREAGIALVEPSGAAGRVP
jgi:hypothetical protein